MDDLQKIVKQQEGQIKSLRLAITQLQHIVRLVDKKAARAVDSVRRLEDKVYKLEDKIHKGK